MGDVVAAEAAARRTVELAREIEERGSEAYALEAAARVALRTGDWPRAATLPRTNGARHAVLGDVLERRTSRWMIALSRLGRAAAREFQRVG